MRLLVTRPQPEADETAARLVERGHEVMIGPVLHFTALPAPPPIADTPAALVFTSRNAVRAVTLWPQKDAWRGVPAFVVGAATARAAREAGFSDVRPGNGDGVALALLIVVSLNIDAGRVVYPAAEDRAPALEQRLRSAGYTVDVTVAYRMDAETSLPPEVAAALRGGAIDGILFYSGRTAATFRRLVKQAGLLPSLAGIRAFVMSESVAAPLAGLALQEVAIAARPSEGGILSLIPSPG